MTKTKIMIISLSIATTALLFTNSSPPVFNLLRFSSLGGLVECYKYIQELNIGAGQYNVFPHLCPNLSGNETKNEYFSLITSGWKEEHRGKSPGWDSWFFRDSTGKFINEIDLRQSAAYYWNDRSPSDVEDGISQQCALREVTLGFDWVDAGIIRLKDGSEPTLGDFSKFYFGAEMRTSAPNIASSCSENPHHFLSLDFIYEYERNNQVIISNAVHLVVSQMNHRDSHAEKDILYQHCGTHEVYGNQFCSVLVDANAWQINTLSNIAERDFKNVNAEFLILISNLEARKYLKVPAGFTWKDAKIRHLQIVNSVRGGARYVRVKTPFAYGILK